MPRYILANTGYYIDPEARILKEQAKEKLAYIKRARADFDLEEIFELMEQAGFELPV